MLNELWYKAVVISFGAAKVFIMVFILSYVDLKGSSASMHPNSIQITR